MEDASYTPGLSVTEGQTSCRLSQCRKTSVRHRRNPEEVTLAGVEDREGAERIEYGCHMCPRDQSVTVWRKARTQHVYLGCWKSQAWNHGLLN